jgi:signal transduction histidine kinase
MKRSAVRFALINTTGWAGIATLFAVQSAVRGVRVPFSQLLIDTLVSFIPCVLLTPFIVRLASRFRFTSGTIAESILAHVVGATGFVVIGGAAMGSIEWFLPWNHKGTIIEAATGAVGRYVGIDVMLYLMVVTVAMAWAYARDAAEQSVAAANLRGQLVEAQLHALTSQLQPHFLFNTLTAISALVTEDPPRAERLVVRLSELLRDSLRGGMQPETSLEAEFALLEKYVEVQEARFGPRLQVTFAADAEVLEARVPRLILQPLVENAIRHGIAPRPGPGAIEVAASRDGDALRLSVRDDGVGVTHPPREGIGLRNTRERLRQLYGDRQSFTLLNQPQGGVLCMVNLPLHH